MWTSAGARATSGTKLEQKRCEEDFERLPLPSTHTIELTGC
jgi:hypothetical protein